MQSLCGLFGVFNGGGMKPALICKRLKKLALLTIAEQRSHRTEISKLMLELLAKGTEKQFASATSGIVLFSEFLYRAFRKSFSA